MKRFLALCLALSLVLTLAPALGEEEKVLNIFSWEGYVDETTIANFTAETGISINYAVFASNEEMLMKLQANGASEYDIIIASDYILSLARKENLVEVEVLEHLFKVAALGVVAGIGKNVVSFLAHLPCVGRILVFHVEIRQGCEFLSINLLELHGRPSFSNGTRRMSAALPLNVRGRVDMRLGHALTTILYAMAKLPRLWPAASMRQRCKRIVLAPSSSLQC